MSAWWLLPAFIAGFVSCPLVALAGGAVIARLQDRKRWKSSTTKH